MAGACANAPRKLQRPEGQEKRAGQDVQQRQRGMGGEARLELANERLVIVDGAKELSLGADDGAVRIDDRDGARDRRGDAEK